MGSSDLTTITGPLGKIGDFAGVLKDIFGGLDYFVGGDFAEFIGGGFMK